MLQNMKSLEFFLYWVHVSSCFNLIRFSVMLGLMSLLAIQLKNFCTGMTTLERMGAAGNSIVRRQIFAEPETRKTTEQDDFVGDDPSRIHALGINVEQLDYQNGSDSFMRF